MRKIILLAGLLALRGATSEAKDFAMHVFKRTELNNEFWAEGANFGDFNGDGKMDLVCGPYWYEGPDFTKRHEFYPANTTFTRRKSDGTQETIRGFEGALGTNNAYSDNFFSFVYDLN